jgi:hypothetical protein
VFIETFLLVVVPVSGDEPMPRPDLHGLRVDPEQARHFVQCEHALLAQPLIARAEPVVAPNTFDDPRVKRAAGARAVALRIQQARDLPVGGPVKELVDEGDDLGAGLPELPRRECGRQGQARGRPLPPRKRTWAVSPSEVLSRVTSSISRRIIRLRSRSGVSGCAHRRGKSVASPRIRARWVASRSKRSAWR